MAKNPYQQKRQSFAHATEAIATEEECRPLLIAADAVHVVKTLVHQELERPSKASCSNIHSFASAPF